MTCPRADVVLVCMPLAAVQRPSLALGLLKAILRTGGIEAGVVNGFLHYLECIGPEDYELLSRLPPNDLVADWIFAEDAFPGLSSSPAVFVDAMLANTPASRRLLPRDEWVARLTNLRQTAKVFLDWMTDLVLRHEPKIVGCTSTFQQQIASLALLRRIRARRPEIVTAMGGANLETVMGQAAHRRFPWLDVVVSGEADDIIVPLFQDLLTRGPNIPPEEAPFGVFVPAHREAGYPVSPGGDSVPRRIVKSLQGLPAPDYDEFFADLDASPYRAMIEPGLPVELSRGCWWGERSHCTFCGLNGGTMDYRARPPDEAEAIFAELSTRYGSNAFEVVDNILAMDYFDTLLIRDSFRDAGYNIFFETKSNIREKHIDTLARAGVRMIQPGIESLHSSVLKLMRKGVTGVANIRLLRLCEEYHIRVGWLIIAEFPQELDSWYTEMARVLPNLTHLRPGSMVRLRFDRYSPYFRDTAKWGLTLKPAYGYSHVYPETAGELADHAYFFDAEGHPSGGRPILEEPQPNRPGLEQFRLGMQAWLNNWSNDPAPPRLDLRDGDEGPVVFDTRPGFAHGEVALTGAEAAVLAACRDGLTEQSVRLDPKAIDVPPGDVRDAAVTALVSRGFLLRLDGTLLSLPVDRRIMPVRRPFVSPSGVFHSGVRLSPRLAAE
jgi:ribosomal peptide maturation radical SAM protein 1